MANKKIFNPFTGKFDYTLDGNILTFKEGVASQANLPITGNAKDDARIANDTGHLYVWSIVASSGSLSDWTDQGDIIDLNWAAITNKPTSAVADIDDAVTKKHANTLDHTQGTDQKLDDGGINEVTVANVKDAVDKKHTQNSDTDLDATFELTFVKKADTINVLSDITSPGADIESAVTLKHDGGTQDTAIGLNTSHRGDNSQAHTDYLINNGDDETSGKLTVGGLTVSAEKHLLLPLHNDAATPTLAFGDGDSGFYEQSDDKIYMAIAGALKYKFSAGYIASQTEDGFYIKSSDGSATIPIFSFWNDLDTGVGKAAADSFTLIAGAVEAARITETDSNITIDLKGTVAIGAFPLTVNSIEIVGSDGEVNKAAIEDSGEWDSAYAAMHTQGTDTTLGSMSANIDMNTHKLTGLSVPSSNGDSIRATTKITESNLETVVDNDHVAVTVSAAPLTLSTQQISFNYDTNHFQLNVNDFQIKTDGIDTTLIDWGIGANQVVTKNFIDYADSPQIITGGELSEGTSGTFTVAALTAMLRATDGVTGALTYVSLAEQANQSITAPNTVYIVTLNYSGGSPTITLSTSSPYTADKRTIALGKVYKDGSDNVHFISSGYRLQDGVRKLHKRNQTLRNIELCCGSTIAYSGTNNFTMTEGIFYAGLNEFATGAYNSASTQFTPVYRDGGGWKEGSLSNTLDYTHYDDGDGTLGNVGVSKFAVFFVYKHASDGHVYVQYGQSGSYSLAQAEAAEVPVVVDYVSSFGTLIGKIVMPQAGGSISLVQMISDTVFTAVSASDHNLLGNLQGGTATEYYHLTSAEYTELSAWLDDVTLGASGALTLPTGQNFTIGSTQWNSGDDIDADVIVNGSTNAAITLTQETNFEAAYSHVSNDGSDHSFINQSVVSGATPTLTATNITGVPAASILAGTLGTGAYVFDNSISGMTSIELALDRKIEFGDNAVHIQSDDDGHLDLTADVSIDLNGITLATDKIAFTQVDNLEYIDSLADGYLDFEATTGLRFRINTTEQVNIVDGVFQPTTTNDIDLGTDTYEFKDLWLDGKLYTDGFGRDCLVDLGIELRFGDAAVKISSETDGHLDLEADVSVDVNGLLDVTNTGQIKFPASANPSSDPNTLDDYEEGTYTITVTCATSGTVTLKSTGDLASYIKIGAKVFISGRVIVDGVSSPVGTARFNAPFTSANVGEEASKFYGSAQMQNVDFGASGNIVPNINSNLAYFELIGTNDAGAVGPEPASVFSANDEVGFSLTYIAA